MPALNPSVAEAVALLRSGEETTAAAAARRTGAPSSSVRDAWRVAREGGPKGGQPDLPTHIGLREVPLIVRDYSHAEKHYVYPLGDVHKGARMFMRDKWNTWLRYLEETPNASMLGTGDFLNTALRTSVSDVYEEEQTVQEAKWELADELAPLAALGRLDALPPGNHENRITKATGDCPIYDVARTLGVPYFKTAAAVQYLVGDQEYLFYVVHGTGSGRAGAQANRLERQALVMQADVYVSGHTHRQQVIRGSHFWLPPGATKIERRRQVYISSGSFLAYEEYAAAMGLPPADIGAPRIRLNGRKKDIHASI